MPTIFASSQNLEKAMKKLQQEFNKKIDALKANEVASITTAMNNLKTEFNNTIADLNITENFDNISSEISLVTTAVENLRVETNEKIKSLKTTDIFASIMGNMDTGSAVLTKNNWALVGSSATYSLSLSKVKSTDTFVAIFNDDDQEIISDCSLISENDSYNGSVSFKATKIPSKDLSIKYFIIPKVN